MRILSVANVPPDPNSGAAGTVYATACALRERGHEVETVWAEDLGPRRIGHGNLHSLIEQPAAYRREVARRVRAQDFDAVMISQPQGYRAARWLQSEGFPGAVVNRSHGLELRVDAVLPEWHRHYGIPESRAPWMTAMLKRPLLRQWTQAVRWFDAVVLPSQDDRDYLLRTTGISPDSAVVIPHGVPDQFLQSPPAAWTALRQRRLLYVGQYAFIKGHDVLVEVLNRVLAEHPEVTMTWVTAAGAHRAIEAALAPAVRPRVQFVDWVPQAALRGLLDQHGVFLFPSFFEGAGKACAEALARGLRVVASDTGGMRDLLGELDPQGRCPVGDVEAFVRRTKQAIREPFDPVKRERQIARLREQTWQRCGDTWVALFERITAAKRDRAASPRAARKPAQNAER